jgi:hypothetical protein
MTDQDRTAEDNLEHRAPSGEAPANVSVLAGAGTAADLTITSYESGWTPIKHLTIDRIHLASSWLSCASRICVGF